MNQRDQVKTVLERLCRTYGKPSKRPLESPLDSLVSTILSQNTSDLNSHRAFEALKKAYPDWPMVLSATKNDLAKVIQAGGLANQKAARIKEILARIQKERGELSLDFLENESTKSARTYLLDFKGVGQKTAACVLLFSLNKPVFPVDTHILRIAIRLGWIPKNSDADHAHALLEKIIPQSMYFTAHINLIAQGKTICKAIKPHCRTCPISDLCKYSGNTGT